MKPPAAADMAVTVLERMDAAEAKMSDAGAR
jgi:hypothetical protein